MRDMTCNTSQWGWFKFPASVFRIMPVILLPVLFAGCQISDSVRQRQAVSEFSRQDGILPYPASERLTYRQYPPAQQNPGHPLPHIGGLFGFLNPFQPQSNRGDHSRYSMSDTTPLQPRDPRPSAQSHQGNDAPSSTPILFSDDPPDIVEFAVILNKTDHFTPEQKSEIIALLRQESPSMRSCIMANHIAAIRTGGADQRLAESTPNPIVQVSHTSPVSDSSFIPPPIRLMSPSGEEATTAEQSASDASTSTDDSPGVIRQVADQTMSTNATFRNVRPPIEPGVIPQINIDTTLPTVATPNDFTTLEPVETSPSSTNAPAPPRMRNDMSSVQPNAPTAPIIGNRELIPYQVTGNRLANRDTGAFMKTKINIVDDDTRISRTMPSLSDRVNEVAGDTAESGSRLHDGNSARMAVQPSRDYDDEDAYPSQQFRNMASSFQRESWDETVRRALNLLDMRVAASESLDDKEQLQDEINLRLLNLTLGNQDDAIRPIDGLPTELQEFWRNTLFGLSTMLDEESNPDASSRFDAAQQSLQTANLFLQNLCPVRIRNQCFINQCDGFGVYEKASQEFRRGEPIFIYAEIENLTCRESDEDYHIQVNSSYEIVDVFGNKVANGEFSQTGKSTQSRIRDVFLLWRVDLPENIMPGKYFIRLYVIDTNHPNYLFDQASLELSVLSPLGNR